METLHQSIFVFYSSFLRSGCQHSFTLRRWLFFAIFTPSTPVCNHLHVANWLKLTWAIISYYYPENQNKGARRCRAHRHFLTLFDMFTLQTEPGSSCWERLVSRLPSSPSCHTCTLTCTPTCFPAFHFEAQDTFCVSTLCFWQVCQRSIHVCNCVSVQYVSALRSQHCCFAYHTPVHAQQLLSWCYGESMGTLITLWCFVSVTWNSIKEVVI